MRDTLEQRIESDREEYLRAREILLRAHGGETKIVARKRARNMLRDQDIVLGSDAIDDFIMSVEDFYEAKMLREYISPDRFIVFANFEIEATEQALMTILREHATDPITGKLNDMDVESLMAAIEGGADKCFKPSSRQKK